MIMLVMTDVTPMRKGLLGGNGLDWNNHFETVGKILAKMRGQGTKGPVEKEQWNAPGETVGQAFGLQDGHGDEVLRCPRAPGCPPHSLNDRPVTYENVLVCIIGMLEVVWSCLVHVAPNMRLNYSQVLIGWDW